MSSTDIPAAPRPAPWSSFVVLILTLAGGCGQKAEPDAGQVASESAGNAAFESTDAGPVASQLPVYEIRMRPEHLHAMERNPRGDELYPATFAADGITYENVKIRHRGAWARSWPKKPLKVFFNEDKPFQGQRRLNLNSSFRDPSFIREPLAFHIYQACGAYAPASSLVRVQLNGQFRGLYVQVEQPDKAFLKRTDLKGATILKAMSRAQRSDERPLGSIAEYKKHYEHETQKDGDGMEALQRLCDELETTQNPRGFFEKNFEIERYINYLAASILTQNWDGYNKNHFLVLDHKGSQKWLVLPWDLDRSLGDHWDWSFGRANLPLELGTSQSPGITGWNRLMDKFFRDPELRARLAERLHHLIEDEFTLDKLGPVIDQMKSAIAPEAALDHKRWPNTGPSYYRSDRTSLEENIETVKRFIEKRRAFVKSQLPRLREGRRHQVAGINR